MEARVTDSRITGRAKGKYVLYWMQQSQRLHFNHALEYAVSKANQLDQPLRVIFCVVSGYPNANLRHYTFMLEGLSETALGLFERGIAFDIVTGDMVAEVVRASRDASILVMDRGYTRTQRRWREDISKQVSIPVQTVESDIVVPVETASPKEEYAARTLRPKIKRSLSRFLKPVEEIELRRRSEIKSGKDHLDLISKLDIDRTISPSSVYKGGRKEALRHLKDFLKNGLNCYSGRSNDPNSGCMSNLSPYLHFGQISPIEIALRVMASTVDSKNKDDFLEQLIVRRELAINYCWYNDSYDTLDGALHEWSRKSIDEHRNDKREYIYSIDDFEKACTHDSAWNAAQMEMVKTGKMHNYMRMYWGKKVIEWTQTPEEAFNILVYLNDRYELDGRDPNGYTGIAWLFGKHDRAWTERPVFGKLRYMNYNGLKRKFDVDEYVNRWTHE